MTARIMLARAGGRVEFARRAAKHGRAKPLSVIRWAINRDRRANPARRRTA